MRVIFCYSSVLLLLSHEIYKFETCAKLHRFHILYITCDFTPGFTPSKMLILFVFLFTGFPGIVGSWGQEGPQGPDGKDGRLGPKGLMGQMGFIGAFGWPGQKGDKGFIGLEGQKGLQGIEGAIGVRGRPGNFGLKGYSGPVGLPGGVGMPGSKGERGDQGLPGRNGPRGFPGPSYPKYYAHAYGGYPMNPNAPRYVVGPSNKMALAAPVKTAPAYMAATGPAAYHHNAKVNAQPSKGV